MTRLLLGLFSILAVGAGLRRARLVPAGSGEVLTRVVVDVTLPSLIFATLAHAHLDRVAPVAGALVAATGALVVTLMLAWLVTTLLRLPRADGGAAIVASAFCNTGFLGLPVVLATYPGQDEAATAAIAIDIVDVGIVMWTLGVVVAQRFGLHAGARPTIRGVLWRPVPVAAALGLACSACNVPLPALVEDVTGTLARATTALIFLSIGMAIDVTTLRQHVRVALGCAVLKLVASPLCAWALVQALHVDTTAGRVAVLQAGMPSAMTSVLLASQTGCTRDLALAVAVVTTFASLLTLPLLHSLP